MVSLVAGVFSHMPTLRSATRALASYHRTDGSLAWPCFAAFFVSLPAHAASYHCKLSYTLWLSHGTLTSHDHEADLAISSLSAWPLITAFIVSLPISQAV